MAFDAATVIRAASSALFALLGLAILVVGWRRPGAVALGALLVCFGLPSLQINAYQGALDARGAAFDAVLTAGMVASAVAVALLVPRPLERRHWWIVLPGILVALTEVGMTIVFDSVFAVREELVADWPALVLLRQVASLLYFATLGLMLVTLSMRAAVAPPATRAEWLRAVAPLLLFGPFVVMYMPGRAGAPASFVPFAAFALLVVALSTAWIVVLARTRDRRALRLALLWPALGMLAYAYVFLPGNDHVPYDPYGVYGILRLAGWALLVYAILRADLLAVPLPQVAVSRGTVAASALALLFIVAQIMQNFLSAQYGLLTGGIVAGAFLFAAQPLQRAMERLTEGPRVGQVRTHAQAPGPAEDDRARREQIYLNAARLAVRDRRLTRAEEAHLHALAEELGLGARRAHELLVQAESEAGVG